MVDNAVNEAWRNTHPFSITANTASGKTTAVKFKTVSDRLTFNIMASWRKVNPNSGRGGV
jgi:hypothetical protein